MAKKLVISNDMTNDEILALLEDHGITVDTTPTIIDIVESQNPEWTTLFLMAEVKVKSTGGKLTNAQRRLKGWVTSNFILRSMESIPTATVEEEGYEIGDQLDGMEFQIQDNTQAGWEELEQWYDGWNPRQTKEGVLLVNEDGESIYRQAVVIDSDELHGYVDEETSEVFEAVGHQIMRGRIVEETAGSGANTTTPNKKSTVRKKKLVS